MSERLSNAVTTIATLESIHKCFIEKIKVSTEIQHEAGELNIENNEIKITSLGLVLTTERKVIADDEGWVKAMEYAFIASRKDDDVVISTVYLQSHGSIESPSSSIHNGTLFKDPECKSKISDFNNLHIVKIILNAITEDLLDSKIFSPTKNG